MLMKASEENFLESVCQSYQFIHNFKTKNKKHILTALIRRIRWVFFASTHQV